MKRSCKSGYTGWMDGGGGAVLAEWAQDTGLRQVFCALLRWHNTKRPNFCPLMLLEACWSARSKTSTRSHPTMHPRMHPPMRHACVNPCTRPYAV
eukprot:207144-Chlamydomonas_euryale.AAC.2